MTEEYLISLLWAARKKNRLLQRALEKAEHDRERYARRIRLLQGGQAVLSRELRALRAEREIQGKCLRTLENDDRKRIPAPCRTHDQSGAG